MSTKETQLLSLTKRMDVPDWKRTNVKWLKANLAKRNSDHSLFDQAMILIDEILQDNNLVKQK